MSIPRTPTPASDPVPTFVALMSLAGRARQVLQLRMQDEVQGDLGPLHLRALQICQQSPGLTQQQLGQTLTRDKGQMARLSRDLEAGGYLVRRADAHDRRIWRLHVTLEGEQACLWFATLEAGFAQELLGGLGPARRAQLDRLLAALHETMTGLETSAV